MDEECTGLWLCIELEGAVALPGAQGSWRDDRRAGGRLPDGLSARLGIIRITWRPGTVCEGRRKEGKLGVHLGDRATFKDWDREEAPPQKENEAEGAREEDEEKAVTRVLQDAMPPKLLGVILEIPNGDLGQVVPLRVEGTAVRLQTFEEAMGNGAEACVSSNDPNLPSKGLIAHYDPHFKELDTKAQRDGVR